MAICVDLNGGYLGRAVSQERHSAGDYRQSTFAGFTTFTMLMGFRVCVYRMGLSRSDVW